MAKTKSDLDRPEKQKEILTAARRLFVEAGYDASSMSRIAEQAGIAPNTIYWYFGDKDALLTTVLDNLVADALRDFQQRKRGPPEVQLMWLIDLFDGVQNLIATVHARAAASEKVRVWHNNFHKLLEAALIFELQSHGLPQADLQPASRVTMFVVEGILAHPNSSKDRRALVRWLVSALRKVAGTRDA